MPASYLSPDYSEAAFLDHLEYAEKQIRSLKLSLTEIGNDSRILQPPLIPMLGTFHKVPDVILICHVLTPWVGCHEDIVTHFAHISDAPIQLSSIHDTIINDDPRNEADPMIERLQKAMQQIDEIPPELQDQIAELIESAAPGSMSPRADHYFGIWKDLDADDMFDELDRMRHEVPPTLPIEEHLNWLDETDKE